MLQVNAPDGQGVWALGTGPISALCLPPPPPQGRGTLLVSNQLPSHEATRRLRVLALGLGLWDRQSVSILLMGHRHMRPLGFPLPLVHSQWGVPDPLPPLKRWAKIFFGANF